MKSSIYVQNLNSESDVAKIRQVISQYEGIIAYEISISKKQIQLVYAGMGTAIDEIINELEINGYIAV